jgi:hypothetical protein
MAKNDPLALLVKRRLELQDDELRLRKKLEDVQRAIEIVEGKFSRDANLTAGNKPRPTVVTLISPWRRKRRSYLVALGEEGVEIRNFHGTFEAIG